MTNFASANVDDVLVTPGDLVITADGTFPLAPGDYVAVGRVDDEVVTDEVPFTIEACPTPDADLDARWRSRRRDGNARYHSSSDRRARW